MVDRKDSKGSKSVTSKTNKLMLKVSKMGE